MIVNIRIPIDGGCFLLTDYAEYEDMMGGDTAVPITEVTPTLNIETVKGPATINLNPGYYSIYCSIMGTKLPIPAQEGMYIPSGKLLVADMCHVINPHKWHKFLEDTECLSKFKSNIRTKLVNVGRKGLFDIHLQIEPLEATRKIT